MLAGESPDMNQLKNKVYVSNLSVYCVVFNNGKIRLVIDVNHPEFKKEEPETRNLAIGHFRVTYTSVSKRGLV